jgi:Aminoglycoside-2''-adenylyltransferase
MSGREPTAARAREQLAALASADSLLGTNGLDYWLFGGWAVDFHVGAITREHEDIDVAVWLRDAPAIESLLEAHGWRHRPSDEDDGGTGYERGGVRLELTFLVEDADGNVFIPLRSGRALWSPEPLGDETRDLDGTRARVVKVDLLRRGKSSPRDDPADAAKDRADYDALTDG